MTLAEFLRAGSAVVVAVSLFAGITALCVWFAAWAIRGAVSSVFGV